MIRWNETMYFGDTVKKKHRKIMYKIEHGRTLNGMNGKLLRGIYGRFLEGIYCVTFASNPENLFDIYEAKELMFPYYRKRDIHIIGLAGGYEEACLIVKDMIEEIYRETGEFKVREYWNRFV